MLANARNAAGFKQYQVAQQISTEKDIISEDTISNWECNRAMPDPEQVAALEALYSATGLWDAWMRLQWPSYNERIPESPELANACMAVINANYQMGDVQKLTEALSRCLLSRGKDNALAASYVREAEEAAAALLAAAAKVKGGAAGGH